MLAASEFNIVERVTDHPWPGCQVDVFGMQVTLMSSGIAAMILVAILLPLIIIPLARRYKVVPAGSRNVLEVMVIFVRDMIGRPALHDRTYQFLPFLMTLFVFILGMNLLGMVPLEAMSLAANELFPSLGHRGVGGAATAILTVAGGLAAVTLFVILFTSFKTQALRFQHKKHWPLWLCVLISPALWMKALCPPIPGPAGVILKVPMMLVEFIGVFARCGALMIRLFANMISGHTLLAVFLMLMIMTGVDFVENSQAHFLYVAPLSIIFSVAINVLELLVAGLQAYVFTFLTAIFIGLAVEESH